VLVAAQSGRVERMHGRWLGQAIIELGGGRKQLGQAIDHAVGLEMLVRIGEQVEAGQPIVNLFAHKNSASEVARDLIVRAVEITKEAGADRRAAQTTEASAETPLMVIP
jgi:thymidine phosphorylase